MTAPRRDDIEATVRFRALAAEARAIDAVTAGEREVRRLEAILAELLEILGEPPLGTVTVQWHGVGRAVDIPPQWPLDFYRFQVPRSLPEEQ